MEEGKTRKRKWKWADKSLCDVFFVVLLNKNPETNLPSKEGGGRFKSQVFKKMLERNPMARGRRGYEILCHGINLVESDGQCRREKKKTGRWKWGNESLCGVVFFLSY